MRIANEEPVTLSKTRRKKAMAALQALGEELIELPADRRAALPLPVELRTALDEGERMLRHDDARRRQMQYIGRLMRTVDPEPIREALAARRGESATETARLHRLERLRADLLADESVLDALASKSPTVDRQRLRSLRRAALSEQEQGKPPRSFRALFRALKEVDDDTAAGSATTSQEHDDE